MECKNWVSFVDHFIYSITKAVPFARFFAYEATPDAQQPYAYHSKNLSEHAIRHYLHDMCEYDPIYVKNNPLCDMEMARLLENDIPLPYQSFLKNNEVADNIELFFKKDHQTICGISLIRSPNEGCFTQHEIMAIDSCYSLAKFQMMPLQHTAQSTPTPVHLIDELTNKERKVLNLILKGKKNQDIANELFVSLATVKTHIQHIFQKTMVNTRQELILKTLAS
ncbi:MAG: LuxR C-terminal-related transcriptional regulator [Acinetobacter sp.]